MKCTLKQLIEAVDFFRYNNGLNNDNAIIEISVKEEDVETGDLLGAFIISAETEKPQDSWSRYDGVRKVKYTLEVFSSHENRPPVLTTQEVQVLSIKS